MIKLRLITILLTLLLTANSNAAFEIKARTAILQDYLSGEILFEKDADKSIYPASMTKIMTAIIAFDLIRSGDLNLDEKFLVSENAWRLSSAGYSSMFIMVGDEVSVENLLKGIIIASGNDACVALAEGIAGTEDEFAIMMTSKAKELGMENYQIPILWAGVSFVTTVFSTPFSALSDKYGRLKFLALGWTAYVLFYLFMAQANSLNFTIWILFGFYGLFKAATEGVERAFVADLTKVNQRGTAFGWFNLITGFMLFPASFIFGFLYESYGVQIAFLFSAISSIIALVILATCKNKRA